MVSPSDVLLRRPGGRGPRAVALNGIACSWAVNRSGSASAECATADLRAVGALPDPRGWELRWEHPTLGPWSGVVTRARPDLETGTTELAAETWDAALAKRLLPKAWDARPAPAGALLARARDDAARGGWPIGVAIRADGTGEPRPGDERATDLRDLLGALADTGDGEWRALPDERAVEWRRRVGRDLSASVTLVEGRQIVGGFVDYDLDPVVNELTAVASDRPFARARSVVVRDEASIGAVGLRQAVAVYPRLLGRSALGPVARADVARLASLGVSGQLDLTDRLADPTDRAWARIREGDTVSLLIGSCNLAATVRVMVRAYDSETDWLTVYLEGA